MSTSRRVLALFGLLFSLTLLYSTTAPTTEPARDPEGELDVAYDLLVGGAIADGVRALSAALDATEDPIQRSHILYLMGRAEVEAGDCESAVARFIDLETVAVEWDPWVSRA